MLPDLGQMLAGRDGHHSELVAVIAIFWCTLACRNVGGNISEELVDGGLSGGFCGKAFRNLAPLIVDGAPSIDPAIT